MDADACLLLRQSFEAVIYFKELSADFINPYPVSSEAWGEVCSAISGISNVLIRLGLPRTPSSEACCTFSAARTRFNMVIIAFPAGLHLSSMCSFSCLGCSFQKLFLNLPRSLWRYSNTPRRIRRCMERRKSNEREEHISGILHFAWLISSPFSTGHSYRGGVD